LHKSDVNGTAPRNGTSAARRTDLRTLLRSRSVQALLVAAGVMQAISATGKHEQKAGEARVAVAPEPVRLVTVPHTPLEPRLEKLASVAELRVRPEAREEKASVSADELARKYSREGYKVTPTLAEKIHKAAVENEIDPAVAFGLVQTESSFKNSATSYVGAVGLTQLMPATARWLQPGVTTRELRDPDTNLRIGFRYLRRLINDYDGNTHLALLAYNRGPGTVNRILKRGGNPDNGYSAKVMGR
jgi:soluble lytic murein transglycosylase-like protein